MNKFVSRGALVYLMCFLPLAGSVVFTDGVYAVEWLAESYSDVNCVIHNDLRNDATTSTFVDESEGVYQIVSGTLKEMAKGCRIAQGKGNSKRHKLWRRSIINILEGIYPGTMWCGQGSLTKNETDLGYYNLTDACCREHDHCREYISPGTSKFGIMNDEQYTICSCECDKKFRACLQAVGTFTSRAVGSLFFNVVGIHCIETKPISVAGFIVGRTAELFPPEPYDQESKVHTFSEVLAGNVTLTGWLGSLFGGK
ncbi:unnamed protein product [Lymnaea stagnalis]|uniref:Phospholipase A2-like central domain-containing protein n=1 Tax=Lymnaea stagnalis TaxID=6523 RepID=A0AAV2I2C7_LYMST